MFILAQETKRKLLRIEDETDNTMNSPVNAGWDKKAGKKPVSLIIQHIQNIKYQWN